MTHPRDYRISAGSLASNHWTQACDTQECSTGHLPAAVGAGHPHLRPSVLQTFFCRTFSLSCIFHPYLLGSCTKSSTFSLSLPFGHPWERMNLPMNLPKVLCVGNVAQREPEATRVQIRIPGGVEPPRHRRCRVTALAWCLWAFSLTLLWTTHFRHQSHSSS